MYHIFTILLASLLLTQSLRAQEAPPILIDNSDPVETTEPLPAQEVRTPNESVPVETKNSSQPIVSPQTSSQEIPVDTVPPTEDSLQPSGNTPPKITVLKLRSMSASEVRPLLDGLGLLDVGEGVSLAVESHNNLLLLRGPDDKIANIRELVNLLDSPAPPLTPVDPESLRRAIQQNLRSPGFGGGGRGGGGRPSFGGGASSSFGGGGEGSFGGGRPVGQEQPTPPADQSTIPHYQATYQTEPVDLTSAESQDITTLRTKYEQAEREAVRLAQTWREESAKPNSNTPQLLVLQRELYKAVRNAFSLRQQQQRLEIEKARRDLDLIEQRLERRDKISDAIIKHRVEELQSGGDLSWASGRPQASHPSTRSVKQGTPQTSRSDTPAVMKGARNFFGMDLLEARPVPGDDPRFQGLLVTAVKPDSPAKKARIQPGDFLMGLDRWETLSLEHILFVHEKLVEQQATKVKFHVVRNGERLTGELEFPQLSPRTDKTSATEQQNSDELLGEWRVVSQRNIDGPVGTVPDDARFLIDRTTIREVANGHENPVWLYQQDGNQLFVIVAPRTNDQFFARCACEVEGDTLWLALPEDFVNGGSPTIPEEANPRVLAKNVLYLKLERVSDPTRPEVKISQDDAAMEATTEQLLGTWKVVSHTLGNKPVDSEFGGTYDPRWLQTYDHLLIERGFLRWVKEREQISRDFYQIGANEIDLYSISEETSMRGTYQLEGDTLWLALGTTIDQGKSTVRPEEPNPYARLRNAMYLQLERVSPEPGELTIVDEPNRDPDEVKFHGLKEHGSSIVYLIDCSGSMAGNNAFDIAKAELLASLEGLSVTQKFQVIFYNEEVKEMNFGSTESELFPATEINRNRARHFIQSIQPSRGTNYLPAIICGVEFFKPDVLFLLTDAQEPSLSAADLDRIQKLNNGKTRIHSVEFGRGEAFNVDNFLKKLARENGGTHTYRNLKDDDSVSE